MYREVAELNEKRTHADSALCCQRIWSERELQPERSCNIDGGALFVPRSRKACLLTSAPLSFPSVGVHSRRKSLTCCMVKIGRLAMLVPGIRLLATTKQPIWARRPPTRRMWERGESESVVVACNPDEVKSMPLPRHFECAS